MEQSKKTGRPATKVYEIPICRHCNKEFIQKKEGPPRVYCSQDCYMRAMRRKRIANHKVRKDLEIEGKSRW